MGIHVDDVQVSYRKGFTLGPISIEIPIGLTFLMGANGAGKSTFMKALGGQVPRRKGRVVGLDGGSVSYLPQSPVIPSSVAAKDYLVYCAWVSGRSLDEAARFADDALALVSLSDSSSKKVGKLSGGMHRRLAIASTIVTGADVILLDEPMAGLDPLQRTQLREGLVEIASKKTVIVSSHLVEDAVASAQLLVVLKGGQVAFSGQVGELASSAPGEDAGGSAVERSLARLMSED